MTEVRIHPRRNSPRTNALRRLQRFLFSYEALLPRFAPDLTYHQNRYARHLDQLLTPGCRWMGLGAGVRIHGGWGGTPPSELSARASLFVGADPVGSHLRENPWLHERVASVGEHLPFADNSFDLVTANMVLEHLEHPEAIFREIRRVLAPEGRFLFLTPNLGHPVVRLASILLAPPVRKALAHLVEGREKRHIFLTHYKANTRGRVRDLCRAVGLEATDLATYSSYPIRLPFPLPLLELLWIKLLELPWLAGLRSNLFGVLTKPRFAPYPNIVMPRRR